MPNFSNFISIYDKALSKDDCTQIIDDFDMFVFPGLIDINTQVL